MYKKSTHSIVLTALLAVMSLILSIVKVPVPGIPTFLTLDLALIPIFFGLVLLGYKSALTIAFLKNILHFLIISREPIGSSANMIVELVYLTCLLYFYRKGIKQTIIGGLIGTVAITVVMVFMNYYVLLPMYGYIMDLSEITENLKVIVQYGIIPFNIIKGIFLIALFFVAKKVVEKLPNSLKAKF